MLLWKTREELHKMLDSWWAHTPETYQELARRHRLIDLMFDAIQRQHAAEIAADPLQAYPDACAIQGD